MADVPEIQIAGGSPTPEEERAVRDAILALWREDQARAAAAASGLGGWTTVARQEATGSTLARSWRAAAGLMQPGVMPARRVGRGDQR
jgi:hypothetical protein